MVIFKILFFGCILTEIYAENQSTLNFKFPKDNTLKWKYRIIGGEEVIPFNLYPFQVALYIRNSDSTSLCGGSLISQEWVVTAAHCVQNYPLYIDVILGAHYLIDTLETTRQTFRTTMYFIHEEWNANTLLNDIALIKLPQNVTVNENVALITVAADSNTYTGQKGTLLGWGKTETGQISNPLLQVIVEIMSNSECILTNMAYVVIKDSHLCSSGVGIRGSCNGDSGGPLVVNNSLVGLVSFGPDDCTLGYPSVFTRVTHFSDWIVRTMEIQANATMKDNTSKTDIFNLLLGVLLISLLHIR